MRRITSRALLAPTVVLAAVAIAGCGSEVLKNPDKTISYDLFKSVGQHPESIKCPSNIPAKSGEVFHCTLTETTGTTLPVTVTESDLSGGSVHMQISVGR